MPIDKDLVAAHNLLAQAYNTENPSMTLTNNVRWFARAHMMAHDPAATAKLLREIADKLNPLDADSAASMIDAVLKRG